MRELKPKFTFYEFFAGGGMARAGLGDAWKCLFANDFSDLKKRAYIANWGEEDFVPGDVGEVDFRTLPAPADLAWASFPCQDLSLAGDYKGLGRSTDNQRTRSGTFWLFWNKVLGLHRLGVHPRTIVLENVFGTLTSHGGRDFAAIGSAVADAGYQFGAVVVDAKSFVPQSRQRVFFVCIRDDLDIDPSLVVRDPHEAWHPPALIRAYEGLSPAAKAKWCWWNLAVPKKRAKNFIDLIEDHPTGVEWHSKSQTAYILSLMSPLHHEKVAAAKKAGKRVVGSIYKRTRPGADGIKRQRAEVRFDDVSGCLRTPAGGSSRQLIIVIEGKLVRTRLLSPREAARLMGLPKNYELPERYNDAYHVCGDGVVVPVVRHLSVNLIEPILAANPGKVVLAAE